MRHSYDGKKMTINDALLLEELKAESPDTDFLIVSRSIDRSLHADLTKCLNDAPSKSASCHVFLTTYGGDPHGGYRVARCLRHHYQKIKLIIPSYCKSAGTMIAIAADELAIGDLGELGPLDVQVIKPNEMQERGSGLDIMTALDACVVHAQEVFRHNFLHMRQSLRLSAKQAGELAAQMASSMLAPLYGQIEPLRIGELQRALAITLEYGKRLNDHSNNLQKNSLQKLVSGYPAHGFVIDRKEAKDLFNSVKSLSTTETKLCQSFWGKLKIETGYGPHLLGNESPGETNEHLSAEQPASGKTSEATKSRAANKKPSSRDATRAS
jgi:Serine dehydrogenase proteinase